MLYLYIYGKGGHEELVDSWRLSYIWHIYILIYSILTNKYPRCHSSVFDSIIWSVPQIPIFEHSFVELLMVLRDQMSIHIGMGHALYQWSYTLYGCLPVVSTGCHIGTIKHYAAIVNDQHLLNIAWTQALLDDITCCWNQHREKFVMLLIG